MAAFAASECSVTGWGDFRAAIEALPGQWIFRGQSASHDKLTTTLERTCNTWDIPPAEVPNIERGIIREFRRRYNRSDTERVQQDTLYCLAIMRHHGAPTRLLDFTYSPYMAAYFAIKDGSAVGMTRGRVWAVRVNWIIECAVLTFDNETIKARDEDATRNDTTFVPMYMSSPPKCFVYGETPLYLGGNARLMQQQGTFLCPGNVEESFEANISKMPDATEGKNLLVYRFEMDTTECAKTLEVLHRHGLNEGNLFPDLDGFARQLGIRTPFYKLLSLQGQGLRNPDS